MRFPWYPSVNFSLRRDDIYSGRSLFWSDPRNCYPDPGSRCTQGLFTHVSHFFQSHRSKEDHGNIRRAVFCGWVGKGLNRLFRRPASAYSDCQGSFLSHPDNIRFWSKLNKMIPHFINLCHHRLKPNCLFNHWFHTQLVSLYWLIGFQTATSPRRPGQSKNGLPAINKSSICSVVIRCLFEFVSNR